MLHTVRECHVVRNQETGEALPVEGVSSFSTIFNCT
jgi:hypothetical protein